MKIIKYKESYSETMMKNKLPKILISLGIVIVVFFALIFAAIFPQLKNLGLFIFIIGVVTLVVAPKLINPLINDFKNYRFGKKGEDTVISTLKETLNDDYVYILNYIIPNTRIGDIDGLLIGHKGIIIIEVKDWSGRFRVSGKEIFRKLKGDIYRLYRKNPFDQVSQQQNYLEQFLKEKGIELKITPIIVLVDGSIEAITSETGIFITENTKLTNHIFKLPIIPDFSETLTDKITKTLEVSFAASPR